MNCIKRVIHFVLELFDYMRSICLRIFMALQGAKVARSVSIRGGLFFRSRGLVEISDRVILNSGRRINPAGISNQLSIFVMAGAHLKIKTGAGLSNCTIYCSKCITIGENAQIGVDCKIYDWDFHSLNPFERMNGVCDGAKRVPVLIGNSAFIGAGSTILKGVCIGDNSIVAAGSVVTKNIPSDELWGGNPALFIRKI